MFRCVVPCVAFSGLYGYPRHDNERTCICASDYGALRSDLNLDGAESVFTQRWNMAKSVPRHLCAAFLAHLQGRNRCDVVFLTPPAAVEVPFTHRTCIALGHIPVCVYGLHVCSGATTKVQFEIIDVRTTTGTITRKYAVAFRSGRTVLFEGEYTVPGVYTVTLQSPHRRQFASVTVQMTNEHGQL